MSANIILSTYCNVLWLHHINHQDNSPAYRIDWWFLTGGDFAPHPGNIWQCLKTILYNHGECSWHLVGPEAGVLLASNSAQDSLSPESPQPQMSAVLRLRNPGRFTWHVSGLSTTQNVHSRGKGALHRIALRFPISSQQQSPFSSVL